MAIFLIILWLTAGVFVSTTMCDALADYILGKDDVDGL